MTPEFRLAGATGADLSKCVHCGLCLQHCPTYVETGLETESPRGRLYLMRALGEGRISATPNAIGHLDMCLQCRNCEAVCPSGVPYGRIMEATRNTVLQSSYAPLQWRLRALFLREVVAKPTRLRLFSSLLRAYQRSGIRSLAERLPVLGDRATLAPFISGRPFTDTGILARPSGTPVKRVGFLTGCIMPLAYGRVHRATVSVLARNGCEVLAPPSQVCCGALHAHNGDLRTARRLAQRNVDAFLSANVDAVVVNSAGCGAVMKEYGDLLAGDERAARFSLLVKDVHEFLLDLPMEPPKGGLDFGVTVQDSCHLAHAQRLTRAPREILAQIPGLRIVEMRHADRCCGSAGVYSLTQPRMSRQLLDNKLAQVRETRVTAVATANPGCMAHLDAGLRRHGMTERVMHVMELLDKAYRASTDSQ